MENQTENIDYLKEALTTERTILSLIVTVLILITAGVCDLFRKSIFDDTTLVLLTMGTLSSVFLSFVVAVKLEKIYRLLNLLKKQKK